MCVRVRCSRRVPPPCWRPAVRGVQVLVYHGQRRVQDLQALEEADVVLTTYSVIENEFRK